MHQKLPIRIHLESDVVVSAQSKTEGGHSTLPYLPGSLLLGAFIAQRTETFDPATYYGGQLRLDAAYPLNEQGDVTYPIPLCYHYPKKDPSRTLNGCMHNLELDENGNPIEAKQYREGFVDTDGQIFKVETTGRMKTAINRNYMGQSDEAQLFEYEAIQAGQVFQSYLHMAEDQHEQLNAFRKFLSEQRDIVALGRSRSAEYGRSRWEIQEAWNEETPRLLGESNHAEPNEIHLYVVSDTAPHKHGMPHLQLCPSDVGLDHEAWELHPEKTFVRTRTYSPFISIRTGYDQERQVLKAGSVITFRSKQDQPATDSERQAVRDHLDAGIGLYSHEGLGQMRLNPHILFMKSLSQITKSKAPKPTVTLDPGEEPILKYVSQKSKEEELYHDCEEKAAELSKELEKAANRVEKEIDLKPTRSQWSQIRQMLSVPAFSDEERKTIYENIESFCTESLRSRIWSLCQFSFNGKKNFTLLILLQQQLQDGSQENPQIPSEQSIMTLRLAVNRVIRNLNT